MNGRRGVAIQCPNRQAVTAAPTAPATLADKAKGWFEMATKPIATYRESQAKASARAERVEILKRGAAMKLLPM